MMAIFVGLATLTRIIFLVASLQNVSLGIFVLLKMFLVGLMYDVIASLYCLAPVAIYITLMPANWFNHLFHKVMFWIMVFVGINLLVFNMFSEWFFWEEFGKRYDFIAVDYLVYTHEVIHNILESYPVPLLLCIVFIISCGLFYLIFRKKAKFDFAFESLQPFWSRLKIGLCFILLPVICFYAFNEQPLSNVSANQFNNELAKDGLYSLFSAFRNNTLDYDMHYKTESLATVMSDMKAVYKFDDNYFHYIKKSGPELKYNVMLVMVESLSAEYMGIFGDNRGWTPNLDKLAHKSLFFDNFYATGTRTTRGMEAVVLSVPPTPGRSIVKRPDCHNMFSAGFIFKDKGYENKFIYAGYGYFDNMNDFFSHNGFKAVDRNDMQKDEITFANVWGVCDEDLFDRAIKESDKSYKHHKPFFNYIMTTSNHRPYTYPDGKIDIPSHTGRSGGVKYTDYAIAQFLQKAASKPWFKDTIFIIVADHNGGSAGETALPAWRYKIPLLIYAPDIVKPNTVDKLCSQIDLMPTLFSILNWSYQSKFYGKDILDDSFEQRAFIGTYQRLGFLRNGQIVILEPDKSAHEYKITHQGLYDVKYKEINLIQKDDRDAIAYYQSASYFFKHRIDRWVK